MVAKRMDELPVFSVGSMLGWGRTGSVQVLGVVRVIERAFSCRMHMHGCRSSMFG